MLPIMLNGSASYDNDGAINAYAWTKISGDSVTIANPDNATTDMVQTNGG